MVAGPGQRAAVHSRMVDVDRALGMLLGRTTVLGAETVPLESALGRTLAADASAPEDLPHFVRAGYDGYALRSEDTLLATPRRSVELRLIESAPAGHVPSCTVWGGEATLVTTGAPLPPGADAIVALEDAQREGDRIPVTGPVAPGQHVVPVGEDLCAGALALPAGTQLGPAQLGLLAALGVARVPVVRRPRAALLCTGDELVPHTARPGPGQMRNSNRVSIAALLASAGVELVCDLTLPDTPGALVEGLRAARGADLIVIVGGTSAGPTDRAPGAMLEAGAELLFQGVAMKPGKPLLAATWGGALIVGLPGNPAAALIVAEVFLLPLCRALAGRRETIPAVTALLETPVARPCPVTRFLRAVVRVCDGTFHARVDLPQQAGVLSSLARSNALVRLEPGAGPLPAGARVTALLRPGWAQSRNDLDLPHRRMPPAPA